MDVRLWDPAKDIECAINTLLVACAAIKDCNRHNSHTPTFDELLRRVQNCRSNLIDIAIEVDPGDYARLNEDAYSFRTKRVDDSTRNRLMDCLESIRDLAGALSRLAVALPAPPKFLQRTLMRYENAIDDAQFESCLMKFSCIDAELMDILETLQRKLNQDDASKSSRKAVKFNSQPPQVFTSFASPLRHRAERIDLMGLAKNAWYEKMVTGRVKYVNCYDEDIVVEDEPEDGYVKRLPPLGLKGVDSTAGPRHVRQRNSLGLSTRPHGAWKDYGTSDEDSETDKEEQREKEEKVKSREEQWEDLKEGRADYLYRHGFYKSLEKAREWVEMEQVMWSRRGDYKSQIMIQFPVPSR